MYVNVEGFEESKTGKGVRDDSEERRIGRVLCVRIRRVQLNGFVRPISSQTLEWEIVRCRAQDLWEIAQDFWIGEYEIYIFFFLSFFTSSSSSPSLKETPILSQPPLQIENGLSVRPLPPSSGCVWCVWFWLSVSRRLKWTVKYIDSLTNPSPVEIRHSLWSRVLPRRNLLFPKPPFKNSIIMIFIVL